MTRVQLARLVAAASVVAATGVLGPTVSTAAAVPCASGAGVTVVVDPGALGGGVASVCDAGRGQVAADRYADIGVALYYVQRQPGFVCRVDGAPASDPCVNTPPADAYWGLWWSDGESGVWTYASIGVTGLRVPDGGAVALAWQDSSTRRAPAVAAPVHAEPTPAPLSTQTPKPSPSKQLSPTRSATPGAATAANPTPTQSPTRTSTAGTATTAPAPASPLSPRPGAKRSRPTSTKTPEATDPTSIVSASADDPVEAPEVETVTGTADEARVPTWVTLGVLVALLAAIAVMTWAARRRTHDG